MTEGEHMYVPNTDDHIYLSIVVAYVLNFVFLY